MLHLDERLTAPGGDWNNHPLVRFVFDLHDPLQENIDGSETEQVWKRTGVEIDRSGNGQVCKWMGLGNDSFVSD